MVCRTWWWTLYKQYGESLYFNGLAEKVFKIGDLEYKLNEKGKKFFDNIYLDPTVKEKEIYSKEIDYKKMSTLDTVLEHKKYFDDVMEKIRNNDDFIKAARLHDQLFKEFFEEYDVLIKYAFAKYGEYCNMKFCGRETKPKIKYDGIIMVENKIEKVEITSPFHDEEEKIQIKQLNRVGISSTKVSEYKNFEENISKKVEDAINKKNSMNSYDNTIDLVVMFDDFEYLFSEQILDEKYMESIFDSLKKNKYKFRSVSVLVDRYIGNGLDIEPRIIKIN